MVKSESKKKVYFQNLKLEIKISPKFAYSNNLYQNGLGLSLSRFSKKEQIIIYIFLFCIRKFISILGTQIGKGQVGFGLGLG